MEGPIRAARAADGRKFSLNRNALVPADTSRPCSHPPVAYMVHFGELLTRQVTPDVTWTSRLEGHEGGTWRRASDPRTAPGMLLEVCRTHWG